MKNMLIATIMAALFSGVCCSAQKVDNSPISTPVDLDRYLGRWFEIARFNHPFEAGITNATAQYDLRADGKVAVTNSGWRDGKVKTSVGKAKTTDNPAVLRVSFFGPFYSDYRILMLSEDYQYALVGSKGANYLWILSRTPSIPAVVRNDIVKEANRRGYDVSKLIWVDQSANMPEHSYFH